MNNFMETRTGSPLMNKTLALRIILAFAGMAALTAAALFFRVVLYPDMTGSIPLGVRVAGVPVQGLDRNQALKKLSAHKKFQIPETFKVQAGDKQFDMKMQELSYRVSLAQAVDRAVAFGKQKKITRRFRDRFRAFRKGANIQVRAVWDPRAVDALLDILTKKVNTKPVNSQMDWTTFTWSKHEDGHILDRVAARAVIQESLSLYNGARVVLPVIVAPAAVTGEKFAGVDFKTPLGTFQTKFSEGKKSRSGNLRRITELLTGYEIKPGETFSYNDVVGARTPENGFQLAAVIANGRIEQDWGGGVCQPSSTLFNAALLAGMDQFDWAPHSRASAYIDPGRDATVVYGQIDFSFRNPHPDSVFVFATATQGLFTASLFSKYRPYYKVEVSSSWWGRFSPGEKIIVDKTLAPGKRVVESSGASGMQAALYRTFIYPYGPERQERLANKGGNVLHYRGAKRIVRVGPDS